MIDSKGYGPRIRHALSEYNAMLSARALANGEPSTRYTDTNFAEDVGRVERGKPYANTTAADWIAERNEPSIGTLLAMEVVLEKPGVAVWIAFNVWPADGVKSPAAVKTTIKTKLPDPRKKAVVKGSRAANGRKRER